MTAYDVIMKKRRGGELSEEEIYFFTEGCMKGDIADYQASALLMAICMGGMTARETAVLTMAMAESGDLCSPSDKLGKICIDKHSTGGVGDKTTLIAAPVCAACGVYVPKMSGRGLGHTGGTIDKLEAIPGFRTSLSEEEFIEIVRKCGFAVSCQTGSLVPADKKFYALRNATATVESIPLICSSIMSKKIATGADGIVLDVKAGDGAFMKNLSEAEELAVLMKDVGRLAGRKCTAVITDMDKPLGKAVGNSIEVIEAVNALKGSCPGDLYEVSIRLAAEMLMLAGSGDEDTCLELARGALSSGKAFETFERAVSLQGGNVKALYDNSLMGDAVYKKEVVSPCSGYVSKISCEKTGLIALSLGAGRTDKDGSIDSTAGILFEVTVGDCVERGDVLGTVMSSVCCDLSRAAAELLGAIEISGTAPEKRETIFKIIR